MAMLTIIALCLLLLLSCPVSAFVTSFRHSFNLVCLNLAEPSTDAAAAAVKEDPIQDQSTLTLLEHINLNVPNHDYILPFYVELLGCGLDPRKAENLLAGSKTVWANCGASQFHLPYGATAQVIPGKIGLVYDSLEPLKERLAQVLKLEETKRCIQSHILADDHVELVDRYGNVFVCREGSYVVNGLKQPLLTTRDTDKFQRLATQYGCDSTECRGISFCEFMVPLGTADKICQFYDCVLDATASVVTHNGDNIAVVAFGDIDKQGRANQSLLFRETSEKIPPYDGHHVAMYVGKSAADFEQAFKNAETAGVVWVNPRFSDKADTLQGAKHWKQFRLKDIVDMETGKKIFELEHEMRSIEHSAWPGSTKDE